MKTYDLVQLLDVVEVIRAARYPDLDPGFLEAVVRAEDEYLDEQEALRAIERALRDTIEAEEAT